MSERSSFPSRPKEQSLTFLSHEAQPLRLEGLLHLGEGAWGAVICHPHPLHGGTMHNKVVDAALRATASIRASTIRFNYRGVGRSEGHYGEGIAEVLDLKGAIDTLRRYSTFQRLFLIGFSFGTGVVSRYLAEGGEADAAVLIAPPFSMHPLPTFAIPTTAGLHMVLGEKDSFCTPDDLDRYIGTFDGFVRSKLIDEADHFFHGHLHELADFISEAIPPDLR